MSESVFPMFYPLKEKKKTVIRNVSVMKSVGKTHTWFSLVRLTWATEQKKAGEHSKQKIGSLVTTFARFDRASSDHGQ